MSQEKPIVVDMLDPVDARKKLPQVEARTEAARAEYQRWANILRTVKNLADRHGLGER